MKAFCDRGMMMKTVNNNKTYAANDATSLQQREVLAATVHSCLKPVKKLPITG